MKQHRSLLLWLIAIIMGAAILVGSFHVDPTVQRWQRQHRWKNIQVLSRNVTRATDWPAHAVAGLMLAAVAWRRGNEKWTRVFLAMIAACALAGIVAYAVKMSTGRVRPYVKVEQTWSGLTTRQNYQSFPSGHTTATFAFFGVLLFASWRIGLCFLPIPIFIGFTRIFLGAHYFSDVVGGALIGILCAAVVAHWISQPVRAAAGD